MPAHAAPPLPVWGGRGAWLVYSSWAGTHRAVRQAAAFGKVGGARAGGRESACCCLCCGAEVMAVCGADGGAAAAAECTALVREAMRLRSQWGARPVIVLGDFRVSGFGGTLG